MLVPIQHLSSLSMVYSFYSLFISRTLDSFCPLVSVSVVETNSGSFGRDLCSSVRAACCMMTPRTFKIVTVFFIYTLSSSSFPRFRSDDFVR